MSDPRQGQPDAGAGAAGRGRLRGPRDAPAADELAAQGALRGASQAAAALGDLQPGMAAPGGWPNHQGRWRMPAGTWSPPADGQWARPSPGTWPPAAPAPPAARTTAADGTAAWIPDDVPWGWSRPPALRPVLLPPGRFHPSRARNLLWTADRASPRLYLAGLVLGIPGLLAIAWINLVSWFGVDRLGIGGIPAWAVVETASWLAVAGFVAAAAAQGRQRRADGWHDYAGPSPLLAIVALFGLVTGLGVPLTAALDSVGLGSDSAWGTLFVVALYLSCYVGLVHFLVVRPGVMPWRDIVRPARLAPDRDDWALSAPWSPLGDRAASLAGTLRSRIGRGVAGDFLFGAALMPLAVIASSVTNLALLFILGLDASDISQPGPASPTGIDLWIMLLAVAVLVPIGEETFFRGFATNAWGRSYGRNSTILRAGLFFAAVHVLNVTATVPDVAMRAAIFNFGARVPVAIALGWLYMRRRSLFASGALHGAYNGMIVLLALGIN
jgi:membrane protease YdiL (CAAX protease family)